MIGSELIGSELIGSELIGSELIGSELIGSELIGSELNRSESTKNVPVEELIGVRQVVGVGLRFDRRVDWGKKKGVDWE